MSINAQKLIVFQSNFYYVQFFITSHESVVSIVTKISWHAMGQLYVYFTFYPQIV